MIQTSSRSNIIDRLTEQLSPTLEDLIFIDETSPRPFAPREIRDIAYVITHNIDNPKVKAYAIYRWVTDNIHYNAESNKKIENKSAIIYALKHKEGTCYSQTRVYIALAKSVGLDARLAKVIVDEYGKKVPPPGHVCAVVYFNGKDDYLLFDPAYKDGDARHKKMIIYSREKTNKALIEDMLTPYRVTMDELIKRKDLKNVILIGKKILPYVESSSKQIVLSSIARAFNSAGIEYINKKDPNSAFLCFQEAFKYMPTEDIKYNLNLAKEMMDGTTN